MTGNDMNGTSQPLAEGLLAVRMPADETGRKRGRDKLVITGGPLGPQLMLFHGPDEDVEEDPNP